MPVKIDFGQPAKGGKRFLPQTSVPAVAAGLRLFPLLEGLSDKELEMLAAQASRRVLARGEKLFLFGDGILHLWLVQKGWVKLSRETLDGVEAVLDVVSRGAILGEAALAGMEAHVTAATVVEPGEALLLPVAPVMHLLEKNPRLALKLAQRLVRRIRKQDMEMESRMLKSASQRLACHLLRLCPVPGENANVCPLQIELELPYDKMLLAARLGMQPETFSRALAKLKKEVNLRIKGALITVPDVRVLRDFACAGCSAVYPCEELR